MYLDANFHLKFDAVDGPLLLQLNQQKRILSFFPPFIFERYFTMLRLYHSEGRVLIEKEGSWYANIKIVH